VSLQLTGGALRWSPPAATPPRLQRSRMFVASPHWHPSGSSGAECVAWPLLTWPGGYAAACGKSSRLSAQMRLAWKPETFQYFPSPTVGLRTPISKTG